MTEIIFGGTPNLSRMAQREYSSDRIKHLLEVNEAHVQRDVFFAAEFL